MGEPRSWRPREAAGGAKLVQVVPVGGDVPPVELDDGGLLAGGLRGHAAGPRSAILRTRWFVRLQHGDMRALTRSEAQELFEAIDPSCGGSLSAAEILNAVSGTCPEAVVKYLDRTLASAELGEGGKLQAESFVQAVRLSSARSGEALAAALRDFDAPDGHEIERWRLLSYLRKRRIATESCSSLPFSVTFIALFCVLVFAHFQQETVYRLTEAVAREAAPATQLQGGHPGALWTWLASREGEKLVARYNDVVAGIQVKTGSRDQGEYDLRTLCSYNELNFVADLVSTFGDSVRKEVHPEICRDAAGVGSSPDTAWLLHRLDSADVSAVLNQVRSWWSFANGTSATTAAPVIAPERTEVRLLAHNAKLQYYVFYRLIVEVRESGMTEVTEKAHAFDAAPLWLTFSEDLKTGADRVMVMVFDCAFVVMYSSLFVLEMWLLIRNCNKRKCGRRCRGYREHFSAWRLLDWLIIVLSVLLTLMYFYCNQLTEGLATLIRGLPLSSNSMVMSRQVIEQRLVLAGGTWDGYHLQLDATMEQALLLAKGVDDLRWYTAVLACAVGLRFFKAYRANPRLNLVLQVVGQAAVDLAHFALVFALVFVSFAVVGHVTFGGEVEDFSTVAKACHATYLLLLGFLFDTHQEQLLGGAHSFGYVWTWAFNIIVVLLFFTMILAIIFDVYSRVRLGGGEAPSVVQQAWEALTRHGPHADSLISKAMRVKEAHEAKEAAAGRGRGGGAAGDAAVDEDEDEPPPLALSKAERKVLRAARLRWSEENLLEELLDREAAGGGSPPLLSTSNLCQMLGVSRLAERLQLDTLLEQALCYEPLDNLEVASLADAVHLSSSIDANVRDLDALVNHLGREVREGAALRQDVWEGLRERASRDVAELQQQQHIVQQQQQHLQLERRTPGSRSPMTMDLRLADEEAARLAQVPDGGLPAATAASAQRASQQSLGPPQQTLQPQASAVPSPIKSPDDLEVIDLDERTAAEQGVQHATGELSNMAADSPEPEPQIGSIDQILEERLARAAEAQATRHAELEEAVRHLTERLQPILQQGPSGEVAASQERLERLEAKVRHLHKRLDPLLESFRDTFEEMSTADMGAYRRGEQPKAAVAHSSRW